MSVSLLRSLLVLVCLMLELSNTSAFTSLSPSTHRAWGSRSTIQGQQQQQPQLHHPRTVLSVGRKKDDAAAEKPAVKKTAAPKKAAAAPKEAAEPKSSASSSSPPLTKKADFLAAIAEKTGLTKKDSEAALTAILETITSEIAAGNKLTLSGFGTFTLKRRAARKGRNPKTGEEMDLPASNAMGFSPSKTLKEMLNPGK